MSNNIHKVIQIYYPALNTYTYLYNGVEYDNMNDAELAKTLQEMHQNILSMFHTSNSKIELADYLSTPKHRYNNAEYGTLIEAQIARHTDELKRIQMSGNNMSTDRYKVIEIYYPALGKCKYLYNGVEYDDAGSARLAVSKQHTQDVWNMNSHLHTTEASSGNNMFDFRTMNDEDWEYLSEMNRARDEAQAAATSRKPECKEHQWVNISLLSVKEVCKVCDVERKEGDK